MRTIWFRLTTLAYAAVTLATVAALGADRFWLLELFSHFRVQYVAVQLILLALLASLGRWLLVAILLPLLALNVTPLLPQLAGAAAAPRPGGSVSLASINLRSGNSDAGRVLAVLAAEAPDIVVLQELTPEWAARIEALGQRYRHRVLAPRSGVYGIGLLSVYPIVRQETPQLVDRGGPAVIATLQLGARQLTVIGVHLTPPSSPGLAAQRNRQLTALEGWAAAAAQPLVLIGDFNATPWSPHFERLLRRTGLVNAAEGRGLDFTWPTFMPLLGIPIDHCLLSEGLTALDQRRGGRIGSDHYPLFTEVAL